MNFPGKVLETNGEIDPDNPNKVKWEVKMSTMSSEGMNLTATVEKASGGGGLVPLLIFVGFIVIIILVAIIAGGKKKGSPEPAPVEDTASEE